MLTIALSKGRILDDTLPLLAAAGIEHPGHTEFLQALAAAYPAPR